MISMFILTVAAQKTVAATTASYVWSVLEAILSLIGSASLVYYMMSEAPAQNELAFLEAQERQVFAPLSLAQQLLTQVVDVVTSMQQAYNEQQQRFLVTLSTLMQGANHITEATASLDSLDATVLDLNQQVVSQLALIEHDQSYTHEELTKIHNLSSQFDGSQQRISAVIEDCSAQGERLCQMAGIVEQQLQSLQEVNFFGGYAHLVAQNQSLKKNVQDLTVENQRLLSENNQYKAQSAWPLSLFDLSTYMR